MDSGQLIFQTKVEEFRSFAFSPGGFLLALAAGNKVKMLDSFDGTEVAAFNALPRDYGVRAIAFSPDGRVLAAGDSEKVRLWDVVNQRDLSLLDGNHRAVTSVAFIPDGKSLVAGYSDGNALIWDLDPLPAQKAGDEWNELKHADRLRSLRRPPAAPGGAEGSREVVGQAHATSGGRSG